MLRNAGCRTFSSRRAPSEPIRAGRICPALGLRPPIGVVAVIGIVTVCVHATSRDEPRIRMPWRRWRSGRSPRRTTPRSASASRRRSRRGSADSRACRCDSSDAGASHVIDGEIMIAGADVTVFARLQDVARGVTVWSDRVPCSADQLFSVEDVIAERVAEALRLRLAAGEQERLRRRYTSNSEAYLDYLRGRAALVRYTPDGTLSAIAVVRKRVAARFRLRAGARRAGDGLGGHVPAIRAGGRSRAMGRTRGGGSPRRARARSRPGRSASGARGGRPQARVRLERHGHVQPPGAGAESQPRAGAVLHRRRLLPPWLHGRSAHRNGEGARPCTAPMSSSRFASTRWSRCSPEASRRRAPGSRRSAA